MFVFDVMTNVVIHVR